MPYAKLTPIPHKQEFILEVAWVRRREHVGTLMTSDFLITFITHHDVIRTHMVVLLLWRRATICAMSHENEFLRSLIHITPLALMLSHQDQSSMISNIISNNSRLTPLMFAYHTLTMAASLSLMPIGIASTIMDN